MQAIARSQVVRGMPSMQAAFRRAALPSSQTARLASVRASSSAGAASTSKPSWEVRMLYDGDCPLCMREVDFLRGRDAGKGKIDFVDIASPSYSAADNQGITFKQAMERIHAIQADGTVLTDIAVFRRLYEVVGLGWLYAITANPSVEKAANAVYGVWAKYRMEITGREALSVILERRRKGEAAGSLCNTPDAACEIPAKAGSSSSKSS